MFIYLFIYLERERERERAERESEAGSTLNAAEPKGGARSHNPGIMTWAEIKSRAPNGLSAPPPGAPEILMAAFIAMDPKGK